MIKNYANLLLKRATNNDKSEINIRKKISDSNDQQIEETNAISNLNEFSYHPTDLYLQ